MKRKILLFLGGISLILLLGFAACFQLVAQSPTLPVDPKVMMKNISPTSPDVATLGRYVMQPPNYSNGQVQQNIPLYEIKENGISFPISLFYNYSGFKVRESASSVGLGWGLTAGVIIRVVKHVPDEHTDLIKKFEDFGDNFEEEFSNGFLVPNNFTHPYYYTSVNYNLTQNRLFYKLYDAQPDLYIYTFGDYSGKFFWINNKAVFIQPSDLLIERDPDTRAFIITTPDGVRYLFNEAEKVITSPPADSKPTVCSECSELITNHDFPYTSTWRLAEIANSSTKAKVSFTYNHSTTGYRSIASTLTIIQTLENDYWSMTGDAINGIDISNISESYYPKEIVSDNFRVSFTTQPRSDGGDFRIEKMQVFNKRSTQPIKTISFIQDYFGDVAAPDKCWLKLKKLKIDGDGSNAEYMFSYLNEYSQNCGSKNGLSIDHWGYFNNSPNRSLIPISMQAYVTQMGGEVIFPWANRNPDFNYSSLFSLQTVVYPTRGYTKYNYESADERGIRVKSLEDFDGEKSTFRYYDYGGYVKTLATYDIDEYYTHQCCGDNQLPHPQRFITFSGYERTSLEFCGDNPYYQKVIEFIGTEDGKGGRTEYDFMRLDGFSNEVLLLETTHYKYGSNQSIGKESKVYSFLPLNSIKFWRIPVMQSTGINSGPCHNDPDYNSNTSCPTDPLDQKHYILGAFQGGVDFFTSIWPRLDKVITVQDEIVNEKSFFYCNLDETTGLPKHTMPILEEHLMVDGSKKVINYYYPGDADPDQSGILGVSQMWNSSDPDYKHMIAPVIKTRTYVDNQLISKDANYYTYDAASKAIQRTGYEQFPTNSSASQKWNFTYVNSNLVTLHKKDDAPTSIVWGYNNYYPVIKAQNTQYSSLVSAIDQSLREVGYPNGFSQWEAFLSINNLSNSAIWTSFNQKLRSKLNTGLVSTYSYNHWSDLTSQIGPDNLVTTYDYDIYGRLVAIKDPNGNLLKEYKYNYQPLFSIGSTEVNFESFGDSRDVPVFADNGWTISSSASWLSAIAINNELLRISCTNNGVQARSATITIQSGSLTKTIAVYQSPISAYLNVPSNSYTFNSMGGDAHLFQVDSNIEWTVSSPVSWMTVTKAVGSGISGVNVICQENTNTFDRSAIITVQGEYGYSATINVIQTRNTPTIVITPSSFEFGNMGGSQDFHVTANVNWIVSSNNSIATKINNSTLRVSLSHNSSSAWSTAVTLTGEGATAIMNISQQAFEPVFTVSPEWYYFDENGGNATISVSANIPWVVDSWPSWVSVYQDGDNVIINCQYFGDPGSWRDGTVKLRGAGIYSSYTKDIPVSQENSSY